MATSRPTNIPRDEDRAQKLELQNDHQSICVIVFRVVLRHFALLLHNCRVPRSIGRMVGSCPGPQWRAVRWGWDTGSIRRRTGLRHRRAGFLPQAGSLLRNGLRLPKGGSYGLTIRHLRRASPLPVYRLSPRDSADGANGSDCAMCS
jgi:hypothetical protein